MSTLNLGELLTALNDRPEAQIISFDFCNLVPNEVRSSRGDYSHLAVGFREIGVHHPTVGEFCDQLLECVGGQFEGYKGGLYVATLSTPIWVDNWGEWSQTQIIGVRGDACQTVILTRFR